MILQMGRLVVSLLLMVLFVIVIIPVLLGLLLLVLCGLAPPLIFLTSFIVFIFWGSHWMFAAWFLGGTVMWCGVAHYVVLKTAKKQQSRPNNTMILILYGVGWLLSLAGVILFLIFLTSWRNGWYFNSAVVCEMCGLACWYIVEKIEKKQKRQNVRIQLLAILHKHTQAELQRVKNADGYPGLN